MGYYDLYGRSYPTRRDAENAETAQCAAIDADLANQRVYELEQRIHELSQPTERDIEINIIWQYVKSLEERIKYLESITKPLRVD